MARPKSWISNISAILERLKSGTQERYRRAEVEQLFAISASQARELMVVAGAQSSGAGVDMTVSRKALLDYLQYSPEGREALQEIERRAHMARKLKPSMEDQDLRRLAIPTVERGDYEWAMLRDCKRVHITSPMGGCEGQLTISFRDEVDLLDQLYRLALAIRNDEQRFMKAVEEFRASGASGGNMAGAPNERKAG